MIQEIHWLSLLLVLLAFSGMIHLTCLYLFLNPVLLYGKKFNAVELATYLINNTGEKSALPAGNYAIDKQPVEEEASLEKEKPIEAFAQDKKQKSTNSKVNISDEQSFAYLQKIEDNLKGNFAFRKQGYTIRDLSAETGIPCYLLSLVINQEFGMNFNELINSYRVNYLTDTFTDKGQFESYTLEAIGKMAGFNSRTAFIAAIKKYTGMTPSAFFGRRDCETVECAMHGHPDKMKDVA